MRRVKSGKVALLLVLMVLPTLLALSGCFVGWGRGGGDRHDDHHEGGRHDEGHGDR